VAFDAATYPWFQGATPVLSAATYSLHGRFGNVSDGGKAFIDAVSFLVKFDQEGVH
jgi:hypothetical protein